MRCAAVLAIRPGGAVGPACRVHHRIVNHVHSLRAVTHALLQSALTLWSSGLRRTSWCDLPKRVRRAKAQNGFY